MIETLIAETEKLTVLINDETSQLLRVRPADLGEVAMLKDQHAQSYAQLIASSKPLKPILSALPTATQGKLRQALEALDAALLRNGDVLLRLQSNSKDLLDTIATALNPHNQRPQVYGASGVASRNQTHGSIALNATI